MDMHRWAAASCLGLLLAVAGCDQQPEPKVNPLQVHACTEYSPEGMQMLCINGYAYLLTRSGNGGVSVTQMWEHSEHLGGIPMRCIPRRPGLTEGSAAEDQGIAQDHPAEDRGEAVQPLPPYAPATTFPRLPSEGHRAAI